MRRQELHPRTAVINKSQKNQSKKSRNQALIWLCEQFPQAFDNTQRIRPLKNGIMDDILAYADKAAEDGISRSKLREAVVIFTRRLDYLACLKAREMRVDLQGNATSQVSEDEAERAATKIKKRVEKSVRNARKLQTIKPVSPSSARIEPSKSTNNHYTHYSSSYDYNQPGERNYPSPVQQSGKSAADIIVKHKTAKQYDPDAVARLKEKLGISRKEEQKEAID
ncbi:ProQ [Legionella quinlivanii]|uniref:ProQ n=1 Tax=Legionella quinlivanii TaxID=45073 RepID=A0A0W0XKD1_9GAMM|nr:ProQ/FinO family protein [Legionella quinlivanii]KTD45121.1 ProQ [Legionella quinlivanii]SEG43867.1 ProP effector [Legionella quinlivanii DSM 21216]STY09734.1 ProQ [Legionella quinlivanii]